MAKRSATSQAASHRGASTLTLGVADQLSSLGAHHRQTCVQTLRDLTRTWVGSLMTWLLIGIALALPVFLHLLLVNVMAVAKTSMAQRALMFMSART